MGQVRLPRPVRLAWLLLPKPCFNAERSCLEGFLFLDWCRFYTCRETKFGTTCVGFLNFRSRQWKRRRPFEPDEHCWLPNLDCVSSGSVPTPEGSVQPMATTLYWHPGPGFMKLHRRAALLAQETDKAYDEESWPPSVQKTQHDSVDAKR